MSGANGTLRFDLIPAALRERSQWVLWRYETRGDKPTKVPVQVDGSPARSNDRATWSPFDLVCDAYQSHRFEGPGFVFSPDDDLVGTDLDGCRDPQSGRIADWALEVIRELNTYAEVSPSKTGVKLFSRGRSPFEKGKKIEVKDVERICDKTPAIEVYDRGRYFALTGWRLDDVPHEPQERTPQLKWIKEKFWPADRSSASAGNSSKPHDLDLAWVFERARKYLAKVPPAVSGQGGHNQTFHAACVLVVGFDLPEADATTLLLEWNERCVPPWEERDIIRKISEAAKQPGPRGELRDTPLPGWNGGASTRSRPVDDDPGSRAADEPSAESLALTDMGNGERFARRHAGRVRYCHPWGKWLCWDGMRWRPDDEGEVVRLAKQTARGILREAANEPDDTRRAALASHAIKTQSAAKLAAMTQLAQSEAGIPILPELLNSNPWLLNCRNGTLDLQTGELRPHRQEDYITQLCPWEYHHDAKCPRWECILGDIFAAESDASEDAFNAELIAFIQRSFGYCLTGITTESVLIVAHGTGANGKTTVLNVAQELLGPDYAMKGTHDLLIAQRGESHPTALADLHGKRLVIVSETSAGSKFNEALVKDLTGNELVRARRMREDFWQFHPTHKLILQTNNRPRVEGLDVGIWRRLRLVPFAVRFWCPDEPAKKGEQRPERLRQDKGLASALRNEMPGILAWAVRGCLDWQRSGLGLPESVRAATDQYREEQDYIGEFLSEKCRLGAAFDVKASELFQAYKAWAEARGERPWSIPRFSEALDHHGLGKRKSSVIYRTGVTLHHSDRETWEG